MGHRIQLEEVAENEGYGSEQELLEENTFSSVVPSCCSDGCEVEPDGHCPHGHPSIMLAAGVI